MRGNLFPLMGPYKDSKMSLREMALLAENDFANYPWALYEPYYILLKNIFGIFHTWKNITCVKIDEKNLKLYPKALTIYKFTPYFIWAMIVKRLKVLVPPLNFYYISWNNIFIYEVDIKLMLHEIVQYHSNNGEKCLIIIPNLVKCFKLYSIKYNVSFKTMLVMINELIESCPNNIKFILHIDEKRSSNFTRYKFIKIPDLNYEMKLKFIYDVLSSNIEYRGVHDDGSEFIYWGNLLESYGPKINTEYEMRNLKRRLDYMSVKSIHKLITNMFIFYFGAKYDDIIIHHKSYPDNIFNLIYVNIYHFYNTEHDFNDYVDEYER